VGPVRDSGGKRQRRSEARRCPNSSGLLPLARNLDRAAELTRVPATKILEIYEALRRGNREADLEALAREIEENWEPSRYGSLAAVEEQPRTGRAGFVSLGEEGRYLGRHVCTIAAQSPAVTRMARQQATQSAVDSTSMHPRFPRTS
jgi:hypothetical protein